MKQLVCLVGCLGAQSQNRRLGERLVELAGPRAILYADLGTLPFFDPDAPTSPEEVERLRQVIVRADAVIFLCPEYGHSLPGVLKNGIDWLIGTGELEGKAVALTSSVVSEERGLRGLGALAQTLHAVSAQILWNQPIARGQEDRQLSELIQALDEAPVHERILVYFNPSCSKSRGVRELLEGDGVLAEYRNFLTLPPTRFEITELVRRLGSIPIRRGDSLYSELGLEGASDEELIDAIVANPSLLERPIVVRGERAVVARPPELARSAWEAP